MTSAQKFKLLIWSSMPTHHQAAFFSAIRANGIDLLVHYYNRVSLQRRSLGWSEPQALPTYERYVPASVVSIRKCSDWRDRIHILPGCGSSFLLCLAIVLSIAGVPWLHWSEASNPTHALPLVKSRVRRFYAWLNEKRGLGALAIGDAARRDFMCWGIRAQRIRYVPYSIAALESLAPPRKAETTGIQFLFLGALCWRKGVDVLLRSFALLVHRYPNAELKIVGRDDSHGEYAALAGALGIASRVSFSESIAATSVADVVAACDVLVLPSRFDGWGMVLSEAASLGRPLIATEACGAALHLIRDGVSGYQVRPEDVEALAERMARYCEAPELVTKHGKQAAAAFRDLVPERNALRLRMAVEELQHLAIQEKTT